MAVVAEAVCPRFALDLDLLVRAKLDFGLSAKSGFDVDVNVGVDDVDGIRRRPVCGRRIFSSSFVTSILLPFAMDSKRASSGRFVTRSNSGREFSFWLKIVRRRGVVPGFRSN